MVLRSHRPNPRTVPSLRAEVSTTEASSHGVTACFGHIDRCVGRRLHGTRLCSWPEQETVSLQPDSATRTEIGR